MEKIWRTCTWRSTTGWMTSWCSMEHVVETLGTEIGGKLQFKQKNVLEGGKKSEKGDGSKGGVCEGWEWACIVEWK